MRRYAKVLGKEGSARYKKFAEEEWHKIEPLTQEAERGGYDGPRWRITRFMQNIAELSGDVEALAAVKSRDLSSALRYLDIAEIYRTRRKLDKALEWAERGVKAFQNKPDSRLCYAWISRWISGSTLRCCVPSIKPSEISLNCRISCIMFQVDAQMFSMVLSWFYD